MTDKRLVLSVQELQAELGISRSLAYEVARAIGVRVSQRRIVVPVAALERWLYEGGMNGRRGEPGAAG